MRINKWLLIKTIRKELIKLSKILERIKQLGLNLPDAPAPAANYVPFMISNKLIFVSGQIPMIENKLVQGKVGFDMDIPEAILAAKACGLAIIAQLNSATNNNLDNIKRIIKLGGFVNSADDFTQHPEVINGASDLMVEVFGKLGNHSRFAVGSSSLPRGVVVEVEAIAEIH